ncbi:MAG: hypothetical protein KTR31_01575 [Myxococcales bacterium]|nr:hypothetical protein [Myxococcales bacterium]
MIPFVLATAAVAAEAPSAEELSAAAPHAWAQLYTCATEGCAPEDASRAAWLAVLHRYVAEGVADGTLAALVRQLDPELFAALPDVLANGATAPPAWALTEAPPAARIAVGADWPPITMARHEGTLVPGFYRSMEELRDNAPSVPWTSPELTPTRSSTVDGHVSVLYGLARREVPKVGKVVGFSDGTAVYLSVGGRLGRASSVSFAELTVVGPVAFYTSGNVIPIAGATPIVVPIGEQHLLELHSGEHSSLNPKRMRALLADHSELLASFEAESDKREVMLDYLRRLHGQD